jgi:hypothetical protein
MDGPSATPDTRRFEVALQTRQLEISLFWQRSLFFWGFISAAFVAVAALKSDQPMLSLLVSGFGFVCSFSWTLVNRGSKYWQEQWETKIEMAERPVTGPFFRTRVEKQRKGWWSGREYSVSKVTIAVSDYVSFVWFCILVRQVWICLGFFQPDRCKLFSIYALSVIPLVYVALLLGLGRVTPVGEITRRPDGDEPKTVQPTPTDP